MNGGTSWRYRGPHVVERLLSETLCNELIAHFDNKVQRPRSYQGVVDKRVRECQYVEVSEKLSSLVSNAISDHVDEYFGIHSMAIESQPQLIYRYGPGVGFVTHHDEVTTEEVERARDNGQPVIGGDLTAVLFLTAPDQYRGGALYFEQPRLELRPPVGSLVTFPATRDFLHGVRPVEDGSRMTLLARRAVVPVFEAARTH